MPFDLRWVNEDERDRVGEIRALCYGRSKREVADFVRYLGEDRRSGPGDWLIAERDGVAVGTATVLKQTMWVRGGKAACQGVAFVGTLKTHRRRRAGDEAGIGTVLMREVLRRGRERGDVVSALMPFRGSYYDHFGYGIVERRADWTIPLSIMPAGEFDTVRFYEPSRDADALAQCRQRVAQRGQADIERCDAGWEHYLRNADSAFIVVDREGGGSVRGWMTFEHIHDPVGPDTIKAWFDTGYDDIETLKRFLHFLGSLRDQYSFARMDLSRDLPLNLLLKEAQMTHRGNRNHPTAEMRPYTRMQVRILDHIKLLSAMTLASSHRGRAVVAIHETEGNVARLAIELADGKISTASTDASPEVEMPDRIWAMIALGDLSATRAAEMGLIDVHQQTCLAVLDAFSVGPAPFCREYF